MTGPLALGFLWSMRPDDCHAEARESSDAGGNAKCVLTITTPPTESFDCVVQQAQTATDAGASAGTHSVRIELHAPDGGPGAAGVVELAGPLSAGKQTHASVPFALFVLRRGMLGWTATRWSTGFRRGKVDVDLDRVTTKKVRGNDSYEVHGTITAHFVPDTEPTNTELDVQIDF